MPPRSARDTPDRDTPKKRGEAPKKRAHRGEGSITQRADGLWVVSIELPMGGDGKRRRKTASAVRKNDALAKLRAMRMDLERHGDLATSSMTTGAWLDYWLANIAEPRLRPNSREQYRSDVRLHIAPEVGRVRLDKLTARHVREMGQAIVKKGRSSTTALRCHRVLSKALKDAVREGKVTRNVAEYVDAPARATRTRGALSLEQAITLLRFVNDDHDAASRWAASLLTGARQGELLGLTWDRVDLQAAEIDLSWQLQRVAFRHGCAPGGPGQDEPTCGRARGGNCPAGTLDVGAGYDHVRLHGGLCLVRPKTTSGTRVVPLAPDLVRILAAHRAATAGLHNPHNLVWTTDKGHPREASTDTKAWDAVLREAGLPDVELHAARHTTATLLLALNTDAAVVAEILGHSSVAVTRGYQHADRTMTRKAMGNLGGLLAVGAAPQA